MMLDELADQVRGFLEMRYGKDFGAVGIGRDEVIVYASRYVGQMRRVLVQAFSDRRIQVVSVTFHPADTTS